MLVFLCLYEDIFKDSYSVNLRENLRKFQNF
jgi:hypothetical protein